MPSGRTHTKMGAWLALALLPHDPIAAAGAAAGVLLSPDLDVDGGYHGLHVIRVLWGETAAEVWRLYWLPYAKAMPHRGPWSHFPLVSTLVRAFYLTWPILAYMALTQGSADAFWAAASSPEAIRWLSGLVLADLLHAMADIAVTAWRKMW